MTTPQRNIIFNNGVLEGIVLGDKSNINIDYDIKIDDVSGKITAVPREVNVKVYDNTSSEIFTKSYNSNNQSELDEIIKSSFLQQNVHAINPSTSSAISPSANPSANPKSSAASNTPSLELAPIPTKVSSTIKKMVEPIYNSIQEYCYIYVFMNEIIPKYKELTKSGVAFDNSPKLQNMINKVQSDFGKNIGNEKLVVTQCFEHLSDLFSNKEDVNRDIDINTYIQIIRLRYHSITNKTATIATIPIDSIPLMDKYNMLITYAETLPNISSIPFFDKIFKSQIEEAKSQIEAANKHIKMVINKYSLIIPHINEPNYDFTSEVNKVNNKLDIAKNYLDGIFSKLPKITGGGTYTRKLKRVHNIQNKYNTHKRNYII